MYFEVVAAIGNLILVPGACENDGVFDYVFPSNELVRTRRSSTSKLQELAEVKLGPSLTRGKGDVMSPQN